ncbi:hypothetical protein AFE_1313 [Acidithiobacillus ferrooxidans ATCC 23270]|uniref:Uncharacterized protein n=1 Tax=Acidithiobacillus ferrooxidans (strain ATCC 23270 / DSM 14882 / CIP 104768 / NCIMB 8455) TaxID=243159 RepID=B7J9B8_ACIF2|nr:hypothetical protein AFE_1313 [Acidithiobacillus ferrooxidans ATCC 23270]
MNTVFESGDSGWLRIYSASEAAVDGAGFWSDEDGWTEDGGESLYEVMECMESRLPLSVGGDAVWQFVRACAASQIAVARRIRSGYLAGNCQAPDVDTAVEDLMERCPSLFATRDHAWSFLMEETHENLEPEEPCGFNVGDEVFWEDPDNGISSGYYTILEIKGEIFVLKNQAGSVTEAFAYEVR